MKNIMWKIIRFGENFDCIMFDWSTSFALSIHTYISFHSFALVTTLWYLPSMFLMHLSKLNLFYLIKFKLKENLSKINFRPNRFSALNHFNFWFFFIQLVTRLMGVLFTCANMNIYAKKPLDLLKSVPAKHWSLDVSVFISLFEFLRFIFLNF